MTKTQNEKVLNFLSKRKEITVAQANRFGVKNLRAVIDRLRNRDGFTIYTNKRLMKGGINRGKVVTSYKLSAGDSRAIRNFLA